VPRPRPKCRFSRRYAFLDASYRDAPLTRFQIFQKKKEETSSTASTTRTRESHFKVVAKRDSLLLPETGHPAGWVNRAAEREELAHKGDGWKSEAFNIVA
jgi:hypothetical protein